MFTYLILAILENFVPLAVILIVAISVVFFISKFFIKAIKWFLIIFVCLVTYLVMANII